MVIRQSAGLPVSGSGTEPERAATGGTATAPTDPSRSSTSRTTGRASGHQRGGETHIGDAQAYSTSLWRTLR